MTDNILFSKTEAYGIANNFSQISSKVLDFRIQNSQVLSNEEATELERCEDTLDSMVVLFRGYGIQLIGEEAQCAAAELRTAIDAGKQTLNTIHQIKSAIKMAACFVNLSTAIITKDPGAVSAAARQIQEMVKTLPNQTKG